MRVRVYTFAMNILFVCKYNNFRSKFAECIFNTLNSDMNYAALSSGIITDGSPSLKMISEINMTAQEFGYKLSIGKKNYTELMNWADVIINVADDVQLVIPEGKKVILWRITDATNDAGIEDRKIVVEKIKQRVSQLINALKLEKL